MVNGWIDREKLLGWWTDTKSVNFETKKWYCCDAKIAFILSQSKTISSSLSKTESRRDESSISSTPVTTISSKYGTTPGISFNKDSMKFWNIPGADEIPNCRRVTRNTPLWNLNFWCIFCIRVYTVALWSNFLWNYKLKWQFFKFSIQTVIQTNFWKSISLFSQVYNSPLWICLNWKFEKFQFEFIISYEIRSESNGVNSDAKMQPNSSLKNKLT